jgi:SpoVK/Ycf46/Vps4 family AAA+-type ATPase
MEINSPFDQLEALEEKKKPSQRKKAPLSSPLEGMDVRQARKVSAQGKSSFHGQYMQVNFRLPPEYKEAIDTIADKEGISKEEAKRWVVASGLQAYSKGKRPETEEKIIRRTVDLPEIDL